MTAAPLYTLTGAYQQLLELADAGEDVTEALALLDGQLQDKALNICRVLTELDGNAERAAAEAARLTKRAQAYRNNADRLRAYIKDSMKAANITKIKSPLFSITLSEGQPKVVIVDLAQVPRDLVTVEEVRTPDKRAILAEYKRDGVIPPGVAFEPTHKLTVK